LLYFHLVFEVGAVGGNEHKVVVIPLDLGFVFAEFFTKGIKNGKGFGILPL
jgi:hypothetical protein